MIEVDIEKVEPVVSKTITDTAEKMATVHGSFWSSRADICKALLTITCAVLVGTISFSGSLIGPGKQEMACSTALIISWLFFVLSIISAVMSLWCSYQLSSYKVQFFNSNGAVGDRLRAIGAQEDKKKLKGALDEAVLDLTSQTINLLSNYDKRSHYAVAGQLALFVLGIISFLVFGVAQVA
ncbi:hypothetical protein CGG83_13515 [Vibrio parahaemolyticus]|uniref:hypothetical protein n=1 Tax=Vibrio parahaemolyticus TaxID=670 RepID=UPI00111E0AA1|nr:hypothetical protein [Vibrio parahaemolyticus]TOR12029.1 hypothetical protein CGG83_13515 [Vibrio parahaemolyticus]TOR39196.1 hypothetical protein CGG76_15635 [Vibrio parahaemolyticus]